MMQIEEIIVVVKELRYDVCGHESTMWWVFGGLVVIKVLGLFFQIIGVVVYDYQNRGFAVSEAQRDR